LAPIHAWPAKPAAVASIARAVDRAAHAKRKRVIPNPRWRSSRIPLVCRGLDAGLEETSMQEILTAYAITFGWAIVGSISMGLGIIIAVKMFEMSTHRIDEWELIKQNNIAMAIILAAVIVSVGIVIASAIQP
jgi:hypothetical protein